MPISSKLLFRPESIEFRTTNDCSNDAIQFHGERGVVIEGRINPPLSFVKVILKFKDGHSNQDGEHVVLTKADGKYKFGPLRSTSHYE